MLLRVAGVGFTSRLPDRWAPTVEAPGAERRPPGTWSGASYRASECPSALEACRQRFSQGDRMKRRGILPIRGALLGVIALLVGACTGAAPTTPAAPSPAAPKAASPAASPAAASPAPKAASPAAASPAPKAAS